MQALVAFALVLVMLIIDQVIKIEVKTTMTLHESIHVTDWFYISFIENNGMAWGMTIMPKLMLSLFRMVAIVVIGWYIAKCIMRGSRWLWIILLSMVLAGAAGNLIDCMFYGMIFSGASPDFTSYLVPFGTGYSSFLEGKVVDMFYFPFIQTTYPDWFPFWGGQPFVFFGPVFNFADACISVSVCSLLLFCRTELQLLFENKKAETADSVVDKE